jgi:hypothetical protein
MSRRRLACLVFLSALVPACADGPDRPDLDFPIGLDRVRDLGIGVSASLPEAPAPRTLEVTINGDAFCILAGAELAATLPGATTTALGRGGIDPEFCGQNPSVTLTLSTEALVSPAILTVGDEYKTFHVDLGDLLVPREAAVVSPADGVLHGGQAVEVAWAPALELANATASAIVYTPTDSHVLDARADAGGRITGTAPAFAEDRDDAELRATIRGNVPVQCDAATCYLRGEWTASRPIALRRE